LPPKMKFIEFAILKLNFDINEDFKEGDNNTISPQITMSHEFRENEKQLIVFLGLKQLTGNMPYRFEIKAGSIFQFDAIPEVNLLKQLATINCPAIIFPYIRETIADLTRRAGFPPLHLDPINFIELAKTRESKNQQPIKETIETPEASPSSQEIQQ
jgi:preprotein translocase subunit SecB